MNHMTHSAEMIHRQRAAEIARNAEFARRRATQTFTEVDARVSLAVRAQKVLRVLAPRTEAPRPAVQAR